MFEVQQLSEKQLAYRDFILEKLGFTDRQFAQEYIVALEKNHFQYEIVWQFFIDLWKSISDEERLQRIAHREERAKEMVHFYPYNIVSFLLQEEDLKKNQIFKRKSNPLQKYISASDLGNFKFCPVAFSIQATIEIPENKLAKFGSDLHERQFLLSAFSKETKNHQYSSAQILETTTTIQAIINDENRAFFNEIKESTVVFSGHNKGEIEKRNFFNNNLNYVASPDYIFRRLDGQHIIVEEKFRPGHPNKRNGFFPNHKVQLASYVHLIEDFQVVYGYLIYWYYSEGVITGVEILRVDKTKEGYSYLGKLINEVKELITNGKIVFRPDRLKPQICAGCVCSVLCGHKTKRFYELELPYDIKYHRNYFAPYPEILKKTERKIEDSEEGFVQTINK